MRAAASKAGVQLREGAGVKEVQQGALVLEDGSSLPFDECLWCTSASAAAWLRRTGLPTDAQGFLAINDCLQSDGGPPEVFAAGDVASCAKHPRPKAGVYAVRQVGLVLSTGVVVVCGVWCVVGGGGGQEACCPGWARPCTTHAQPSRSPHSRCPAPNARWCRACRWRTTCAASCAAARCSPSCPSPLRWR
jgi:hypothetical protein